MSEFDRLDWDKQAGLVPAIVQDARTLRVLMLGWMNREALAMTQASGWVTFYSRSRGALWTKGETSGHRLQCVSLSVDCDADTLLVSALPQGPTCHLGRDSCFPGAPGNGLAELDAVVDHRMRERPAGSYTARLLDEGPLRIAQKVGEEGVEVALAGAARDDAALLGEAADLVYHLIVLLRARGLGLSDLETTLASRR
ncbi:bifunctional phosphoribosyl-AMP cyclohydrolase/phosphoribosyl-ATP diphosphatase [Lysobacter oculi]|uniref:Histidine biosynthesis bifunctional protein HisIE n=1 Tax=Solilutibacter oculi TaxID=2698682 RepID=A0A344J575_9GAMM|nr:bifunctional phosphoribosyl-AMP cyclohydrolase/phosphoribosyl-ATP diphosphatase HisIE [Lysobacter oculi]AXA84185.1 bifunctional phosphoribosyl-AMP cyclohydrolase/phosphoribosyl-ATP diphosphatase [Lysobacter oculi]